MSLAVQGKASPRTGGRHDSRTLPRRHRGELPDEPRTLGIFWYLGLRMLDALLLVLCPPLTTTGHYELVASQ